MASRSSQANFAKQHPGRVVLRLPSSYLSTGSAALWSQKVLDISLLQLTVNDFFMPG
jgi:hypothetical protein